MSLLRFPRSGRQRRRGFSLLEAILAMTILTSAIVVLGELVRMGARHAALARDVTQAQLLCESTLNEIAAGMSGGATAMTDAPIDASLAGGNPNWVYSVAVGTLEVPGLIAVQVTVRKNEPANKRPASYSLTRWMKDPSVTLVPSDLLTTETTSSSSTSSGAGSAGSAAASSGASAGGTSGR